MSRLDLDAFHALVGGTDYPMFIVTVSDGNERAGCLVGFVTQTSIEPPRLLVCLSKANRTYRVSKGTQQLIVHFLADTDSELAALFGEETGDETDNFADCEWHAGPGGAPVLAAGRGWVAADILARVDGGDHEALLVSPREVEVVAADRPQLSFHQVRDLQPGHPA
ncbi:MAG: flavin reductase family protein [Acidimicrobiales bacterium]